VTYVRFSHGSKRNKKMKISKSRLRQIIKEELETVLLNERNPFASLFGADTSDLQPGYETPAQRRARMQAAADAAAAEAERGRRMRANSPAARAQRAATLAKAKANTPAWSEVDGIEIPDPKDMMADRKFGTYKRANDEPEIVASADETTMDFGDEAQDTITATRRSLGTAANTARRHVNKLHNSGKIDKATWRKARRALYKPNGLDIVANILDKAAPTSGEKMVAGAESGDTLELAQIANQAGEREISKDLTDAGHEEYVAGMEKRDAANREMIAKKRSDSREWRGKQKRYLAMAKAMKASGMRGQELRTAMNDAKAFIFGGASRAVVDAGDDF
jgi:hypothetical protein